MAARPKTYPENVRGEGSWGYDPVREKITLRHRWEGKSYTERGESFEDCRAKRNRRRRIVSQNATVVGGGEATLTDLMVAWFEFWSTGKAPQTIRKNEWVIRRVGEHLGDTLLSDLDVAALEDCYAELIDGGAGINGESMRHVRSTMRRVFKFGDRRSWVPEGRSLMGRYLLAEVPDGAPRSRRKEWFDLVDFDIVRSELIHRRDARSALLLTMLLTGLRPGEAVGLKWKHVDLERRQVRVEGAIQRGDNGSTGEFTDTLKTDRHGDAARRTVPMLPDLKLVLADMKTRADSEYVFSENGTFLSFNVLASAAQISARDCGVKYVHPNGYRHSFASMCRHAGVPYEVLAVWMGHKDAAMIIKTYGHPMVATETVDIAKYLGTAEF